jgi:hypothetical protein
LLVQAALGIFTSEPQSNFNVRAIRQATDQEVLMGEQVLELKTDTELLRALKSAAGRKPSAEELVEQRVSYIYGAMDSQSGVTRERIKQTLDDQDGLIRK